MLKQPLQQLRPFKSCRETINVATVTPKATTSASVVKESNCEIKLVNELLDTTTSNILLTKSNLSTVGSSKFSSIKNKLNNNSNSSATTKQETLIPSPKLKPKVNFVVTSKVKTYIPARNNQKKEKEMNSITILESNIVKPFIETTSHQVRKTNSIASKAQTSETINQDKPKILPKPTKFVLKKPPIEDKCKTNETKATPSTSIIVENVNKNTVTNSVEKSFILENDENKANNKFVLSNLRTLERPKIVCL